MSRDGCHVYWQSLTLQNESMEITIEQDKKTILSLQGELGETHAKLLDYESHFSQKVAEVEDQFRAQIHSLMTENTELRRRFMKKCDAYYHLQAEKDRIQRRQVKLLEQKMQSLVEVQLESQSQVSLVTQNLSPIMSTQLLNEQKDSRPISAPPEALANINDDNKVDSQPQQRIRPKTCGTTVRTKIPDVFR
jgi:putative heme degradation protein